MQIADKKELERQYPSLIAEIRYDAFNQGLTSKDDHIEPSPKTLSLFEQMEKRLESHEVKLNELCQCFYGNPEKNLMGMSVQVNELYTIFTQSSWLVKLILKLFLTIGTITGAIIGIFELFKRIKH